MKRIIAIWFAVSLVFYIIFGITIDSRAYLERFTTLQSPLVIFNDLVNVFDNIKTIFNSGFGSFKDVLKVVVEFFRVFYEVLILPLKLLGYILDCIMVFIPIGLGV